GTSSTAVSEFDSRVVWLFDRISPFVLRSEQWVRARVRSSRLPGTAPAATSAARSTAAASIRKWLRVLVAWGARAAAAATPLLASARQSLGRLAKWRPRFAPKPVSDTTGSAAPKPEAAPRTAEPAPTAEPIHAVAPPPPPPV